MGCSNGMSAAFKKILYPTDFSELSLRAIPYVRGLAEAFGGCVKCLHVVDDGCQTWVLIGPESVCVAVPIEELATVARQHMEKFAAEHLAGFVPAVTTQVVVGRAFVDIITAARDWEADLIVMCTHGRGAISQILLGSTTEKVVRKSPCPVMTIRDPKRQYVAP